METPVHPSRNPLHTYMTHMRDSGATPIHDGMRTPMRDRASNPYTTMSPPSLVVLLHKHMKRPHSESGWTNTGNYSDAGTPRDNSSACENAPSPYLPSTPGEQPPVTPSLAYLPGTPGGQPGTDNEGPWFLPDILVIVNRSGKDNTTGLIREVLQDGSCKVASGANGNGEMVTALPSEIEIVVPRKAEKIKIMGGAQRRATGILTGIDGSDGIVKLDDTLDVKILEMVILAKLVQA